MSLPVPVEARRERRIALPGFDWPRALGFLGQRAIEGVEAVDGPVYRRVLRHDGAAVRVEVGWDGDREAATVAVGTTNEVVAEAVTARLARMLDADFDATAVMAHLGQDPWLVSRAEGPPALHVLGGPDPFEIAVRAIIGQQVSIARARDLNGRLVRRCGVVLPDLTDGTPRPVFPSPDELFSAELVDMGMPGARVRALRAVAEAAIEDPDLFVHDGPIEPLVDRLTVIRGVGPWTAHYVAMRACRHPDAFPASDVGLLRGAARGGERPTPAELSARAEAWRPYRSYAAQVLWAADAASRS